MKQKNYETYVFDFDGTLVDSMPSYIAVMLRILDEYKIPYTKDIVKIITPLGYGGAADYFRTLGLDEERGALIEKMTRYASEQYANHILAKEGVAKTLCTLRQMGASLHVLTASPHSMLDVCLRRNGLWEYFDNVWSCEDFNTTKADPEIYRMVSRRLGTNIGDIVFVDDNLGALTTAKAAGMRVLGIFDASSEDARDEIRAVADGYLNSFAELLDGAR